MQAIDPQELYPFHLDQFQLQAIAALQAGKSVVVCAPTGSGKTLIGEYAIHVLCDGEDIPNSPYMAWIKSKGDFDPTKVKALPPSVGQNQLIVGKPVELIVDCSEAGDANLKVTVIGADYKKVLVTGIYNKNGTYACRFTPISPNKHIVFVTYESVCIPNFPAKVINRHLLI